MSKFWFSYSLGPLPGLDCPEPRNAPYVITWHLGRYLRDKAAAIGYEFAYRNLDSAEIDAIGPDDIVLGHTWFPDGWLNRALDSAARLKFVMQPYSEGMVAETERAWIKSLFAKADHLFLITGPEWWRRMPSGPYAEWQAKATRLDMAINPDVHPYLKLRWSPPGKRGFVAIGSDIPAKGIDLVAQLARMGGCRLLYYGNADASRFEHVPQAIINTGEEFTPDAIERLCHDYDFFLAMGRFDANPTTLLETTAWGLVAACTPESGYPPDSPFLELRLDDMPFNLEQIERLQTMPEYDLRQRSERLRHYIEECHRWEPFCETVWQEVERRL